ncbi:hypothetical protein VPH35_095532 [Triticum aestivum]|uniref:Uncharacterized protein n=1 Tax=Aegilops tauschii TaxID=37682 RepID=M8ARE5_AEGTA
MTNGSGGMDLTITGDGRCLCAVPLLAIKWIWDKGFGIVNAFHPPDFVKEVCRNNNIAKLHRLCNTNIPKVDGYGINSIADIFFTGFGYKSREELRFPAEKTKSIMVFPSQQ